MSTTQLERESNPADGQLACPKPQYTNVTTGEYEALKGDKGAAFAQIVGKSGERAEVSPNGDLYVMADFCTTMQQLLMAIKQPPWYDPANTRINTNVASCTLAANQDIRTVTNLNVLDSYQAKILVLNNNTAAWAAVCRSRIS